MFGKGARCDFFDKPWQCHRKWYCEGENENGNCNDDHTGRGQCIDVEGGCKGNIMYAPRAYNAPVDRVMRARVTQYFRSIRTGIAWIHLKNRTISIIMAVILVVWIRREVSMEEYVTPLSFELFFFVFFLLFIIRVRIFFTLKIYKVRCVGWDPRSERWQGIEYSVGWVQVYVFILSGVYAYIFMCYRRKNILLREESQRNNPMDEYQRNYSRRYI